MRLAIYNHGIAFDGGTPFREPLGGSESSIVYMARELVRAGHPTTVYANCPAPGDYEGVSYKHYHQFFTDCYRMPWDALISFRSLDPFLIGRVAPRMIFWTGDAFDQPALNNFGHHSLQENIDRIFCVSEWHRQTFIEAFGVPEQKVIASRNGFNPEFIPPNIERDRFRSAYTSTPFRGLEILLKMFPELRCSIPGLSLDVFSSMKVYGWTSDQDRAAFGDLYASAAQPGVCLHGSVSQPALAASLAETAFLLYPNTYDETSCIAAIEAQACGVVVITSAKAALKETVVDGITGFCIKGDPKTAEYQYEFIRTVVGLSENRERLLRISAAARARAWKIYTWASVAADWTAILTELPGQHINARWTGPLILLQKTHDYLQNGNVSAARRVLSVLDQTPFLRNEVESLKGQLSTWK